MRHPFLHQISLRLQDRSPKTEEFDLTAWLFLRALGLIYFSAFVSFGVQAMGLIGSHGILPLATFIEMAHRHLGAERYWLMPMVFWFNASDLCIQAVCWGGAALSLLVVANILPRVSLFLLYALYLSLIYAGQTFMSFQWDMLLTDVGFLGLLLSISVRPGILLVRWLVFRFMFLSGVVKVASGDPAWRDLSALAYHFQTQPLPTPIAWYAQQLPFSVLSLMTLATLITELGFPFLLLFPRRVRFVGAFGILLLQTLITLTGNYNFFNLLVIACCLCLFDDAALEYVLPQRAVQFIRTRKLPEPPGRIGAPVANAFAIFIVFATCVQLAMFVGIRPAMFSRLEEAVAPFRIVNTYGPFAVMTTKREEIVVEGSDDGVNWKEYGFRYKPGDIKRAPLWNIPHQPRLDWQFWFASLESPYRLPWFGRFLQCLLEGDSQVTALLETDPFPRHPPHYVRALFYEYRFSTSEEKKKTGDWWERDLEGIYFPQVALEHPPFKAAVPDSR